MQKADMIFDLFQRIIMSPLAYYCIFFIITKSMIKIIVICFSIKLHVTILTTFTFIAAEWQKFMREKFASKQYRLGTV